MNIKYLRIIPLSLACLASGGAAPAFGAPSAAVTAVEPQPSAEAPHKIAPLPESPPEPGGEFCRVFTPIAEKEAALDVARTHSMQPGQHVVVRGRIIGAERLFEENEALFMIADPAYVVPDDHHAHPYRAGTVSAAVKRAHMLSVQIRGAEGRIVPLGLRGAHGLKELDYVVVSGVMDAETTSSSPVVNAKSIEIVDPWPLEAPSAEENPPQDEPSCISCAGGSCPPEAFLEPAQERAPAAHDPKNSGKTPADARP